jgi:hypothetical protein
MPLGRSPRNLIQRRDEVRIEEVADGDLRWQFLLREQLFFGALGGVENQPL